VSSQSKAILDLGKKLVDELGLDEGVDTLGRWMAHYIAELILDAENAAPENKALKQERCASAILNLWRHRAELPNGTRPFEDVEPILRALASLDACDETPRYFPVARAAATDVEGDTEAGKWLEIANGIDSTAKELIRHCLARAAQTAQDKTLGWVTLAEEAGLEDSVDASVLRILIREAELADDDAPEHAQRKKLGERLDRLDAFGKLAAALADDIRSKLNA